MRGKLAGCLCALALVGGLVASAPRAEAAAILLQSGNPAAGQTESCANPFNASTACVAITPDSLWQGTHPAFAPNLPGFQNLASSQASWVSFAKTGVGPDNVVVPQNLYAPSMIYTLTFNAPADARIIANIWADDTAKILVDGVFINSATFDTSFADNHICEDSAPSCTPGKDYVVDTLLGAGTSHSLEFDVYQIGNGTTNNSNPFGLLFVGEVDPVPEPPAALLLAAGLSGFLLFARRRRAAAI
ncbi:MAG TPA: PEP-CTERM sorting domain-containing protein [Alphaproteobacteria bacterium]|nr:PEP-CTERM sorting domain-containing protein [Alphaproteobacteria bacterium]